MADASCSSSSVAADPQIEALKPLYHLAYLEYTDESSGASLRVETFEEEEALLDHIKYLFEVYGDSLYLEVFHGGRWEIEPPKISTSIGVNIPGREKLILDK